MPRERRCDFCESDIEPGTGTVFVRTDGTTIDFCSSKCEKNADLGRESRDLEWAGREEEPEVTETESDEEPADEQTEEADSEEEVEEADSEEEVEEADSEEEASDDDTEAENAEAQT